jgi:single-stranded-DNA-specific exonuclease
MRWTIKPHDPVAARRLSAEAQSAGVKISPLIADLLVQRGITGADQAQLFLSPSLSHLHSPYLMLGLKQAVERLRAAIERKETILIYGDYDVDGTLAVVILKTAIEICGGTADFHVPHRIQEGYGMKSDVIEQAAAADVRLIISVDTGIRAFAAAETAHKLGLDLIVTDHHLPEVSGIPKAVAVLNPNQPDCGYPCKELCGAGVAFKLAQALLEGAGHERLLPSFIKMVAIATIADAVPLVGENRVLAKLGLDGLRTRKNPGLNALFEVAAVGQNGSAPSASDVAFRLAPRLNAAGRMDVANDVISLFTSREMKQAQEIAAKLNQLNAERQNEEARIVKEIQERLDGDAAQREPYCLVVDGDGWHRGVIGIVATRVVERYGRPALVLARDVESGEAHGSGRSIAGFHLLEALEQPECRRLFTRFGGHAHAVGFSLPGERVSELRARIDEYARGRLTPEDLVSSLAIDMEIDLEQVTRDLCAELEQLEPFGQGNREPVLAVRNAVLLQPPKVLKEKHLKLRVGAGNGNHRGYDALGWRMAERIQKEGLVAGERLNLAFNLEENQHPDFGGPQMILQDFAKVEAAVAATQSALVSGSPTRG